MITVNFTKAQSIAHDFRRAARDIEFAPHDATIAKQIPGKSEAAEQARAAIREKYAVVQSDVDAAITPEELRAVLTEHGVIDVLIKAAS